MIIRQMKLQNFRQYVDAAIEFSTDKEKNITVIMGDNGTGKTTLAQAFQWVLYGKTNFQIHELLNRMVREKMGTGEKKEVSVLLDVTYNNQDYTLRRIQEYYKNANQKVEERQGKFTISQIDNKGNVKYVPEHQKDYIVKQLLPKDLSNFFFFDGEKIEEMSKEIQSGKSSDFQNAVYSLVGLTATQNTIEHLKSSKSAKKSVLKEIQREIDKNAASAVKMEEKNKEIEELSFNIEKYEAELKRSQEAIQKLEEKKASNDRLIKEGQSDMKLKEAYEKLEKDITNLTREKNEKNKDMLKMISNQFYRYCTYGVAKKAVELIEEEKQEEPAIPDLTTRTIDALLKRGRCICGTVLCEGQLPYEQVMNLRESSYPKTIASLKSDYAAQMQQMKGYTEFAKEWKEKLNSYESTCAQLEGKEIDRNEKQEQMADTSSAEKALHENREIEKQLPKLNQQIGSLQERIKDAGTKIQIAEQSKESMIVNNDDVTRNKIYLAYANELYNSLSKEYKGKEDINRVKLQTRMNEIFASIYGSNIAITIDPRYRIQVRIDEELASTDEVERNTAQGYALIFTFISAIIDLAKEKVNDEALTESELIDEDKEGYPLVMDAPLSAFDKTRIEKICTEIPRIADQVIMFIKDTDGEVAEEHMKNKIGCRYMIEMVNESKLNSRIVGRS